MSDLQAFADAWGDALVEAEPPVLTDLDLREEGEPEYGPHDCRANEVEESSHPTRSGRISVTGVCGICGTVTTPTYTDSIF